MVQNILGSDYLPQVRCLWCTDPPREEVAVQKFRGDDIERITIKLCGRHLERLRKAGAKGREFKGWSYKIGWWT